MKIYIDTDRPESECQRLRFEDRHRCPKCSSLIYSRKSLACGICGLRLPDHVRLQENERRRLAEMLASERLRHKQWLSRREPAGYHRLSVP